MVVKRFNKIDEKFKGTQFTSFFNTLEKNQSFKKYLSQILNKINYPLNEISDDLFVRYRDNIMIPSKEALDIKGPKIYKFWFSFEKTPSFRFPTLQNSRIDSNLNPVTWGIIGLDTEILKNSDIQEETDFALIVDLSSEKFSQWNENILKNIKTERSDRKKFNIDDEKQRSINKERYKTELINKKIDLTSSKGLGKTLLNAFMYRINKNFYFHMINKDIFNTNFYSFLNLLKKIDKKIKNNIEITDTDKLDVKELFTSMVNYNINNDNEGESRFSDFVEFSRTHINDFIFSRIDIKIEDLGEDDYYSHKLITFKNFCELMKNIDNINSEFYDLVISILRESKYDDLEDVEYILFTLQSIINKNNENFFSFFAYSSYPDRIKNCIINVKKHNDFDFYKIDSLRKCDYIEITDTLKKYLTKMKKTFI